MSPNPQQQVMQVATGYIASSALYVAAKLLIADKLEGGARSVAELADETATNADALYRVLRLLVSLGIFEEVAPRKIALNPAGEALRSTAPGSMHAMALFLPDPLHFRAYAELLSSVESGSPAVEKVVGMPVFEYLAEDPEYSEIFNNAMTALSASVADAATQAYDFSVYGTIVDIAGGHGEVLMSILQACPESKGILAEVDHVVKGALPRISQAGLQDRCEAVVCNFFKAVPTGGDVYVMKHIIHDWDDERAKLILSNIATAMGTTKGHVVLLDSVIPAGPQPDLGKFIDIEMLAMPGGKERTEQEFSELFAASGFRLTRIVPTQSPLAVIEAVRI